MNWDIQQMKHSCIDKNSRFAAIFHDINWPAYGHGHFYCLRFARQ